MALQSHDAGDITATVKNTFLSFDHFFMPSQTEPRRRSVPPSSRLCQASHDSIVEAKLVLDNIHSDTSTYETEASFSESGTRTPCSVDDPSPRSYAWTSQEVCVFFPENSWSPPFAQIEPPPKPHTERRPLNSKAAAFQPVTLNAKAAVFQPMAQAVAAESEPNNDFYKKSITEVIRLTKVAMKHCPHVKDVEISEDASGWSIAIQPKGNEGSWQSDRLMTLAKEALLDAAAKSKCIYVMGYCAPKPFNMRPQGFEATLGAMRGATSACWHVFKKGFCQHEDNCCKQHPACQVPVHVLVEGVQLSSCPHMASVFKHQVGDLALAVTAALDSSHVEMVKAFKDKDNQGWTIEMTAKENENVAAHKEYLLTLAKNALFSATTKSETTYIMGYATKPFMWKSTGFVTIVGDMLDESRACWDMYSKGCCSKGSLCRWEHPECLMPINVVVKERSCLSLSLNGAALGE